MSTISTVMCIFLHLMGYQICFPGSELHPTQPYLLSLYFTQSSPIKTSDPFVDSYLFIYDLISSPKLPFLGISVERFPSLWFPRITIHGLFSGTWHQLWRLLSKIPRIWYFFYCGCSAFYWNPPNSASPFVSKSSPHLECLKLNSYWHILDL